MGRVKLIYIYLFMSSHLEQRAGQRMYTAWLYGWYKNHCRDSMLQERPQNVTCVLYVGMSKMLFCNTGIINRETCIYHLFPFIVMDHSHQHSFKRTPRSLQRFYEPVNQGELYYNSSLLFSLSSSNTSCYHLTILL